MDTLDTVLMDMDGILADLLSAWLARYNAEYHDQLTPAVIRDWDLDRYVKPACGRDIYRYLRDPELFRSLTPIPGAVDGLTALAAAGVPLRIVSAAPDRLVAAKQEWLARHFGALGATLAATAVFTAEKYRVDAAGLVDDSPAQQRAYRQAHPDAFVVTLAHPYNTAWTGATRYPDWPRLTRGILRHWHAACARA